MNRKVPPGIKKRSHITLRNLLPKPSAAIVTIGREGPMSKKRKKINNMNAAAAEMRVVRTSIDK